MLIKTESSHRCRTRRSRIRPPRWRGRPSTATLAPRCPCTAPSQPPPLAPTPQWLRTRHWLPEALLPAATARPAAAAAARRGRRAVWQSAAANACGGGKRRKGRRCSGAAAAMLRRMKGALQPYLAEQRV